MTRIKKDNKHKFAILGVLKHESASGYDIKKYFKFRGLRFFWPDLSLNQIYPTLKQLEEEKLVTMKKIEKESRISKIYSITENGKEELSKWLSKPSDVGRTDNMFDLTQEVLLKTYYGGSTTEMDSINEIQELIKVMKKKKAELKQFEKHLKLVLKDNKDHPYFLLSVLMGIGIADTVIAWGEESIKTLRKLD